MASIRNVTSINQPGISALNEDRILVDKKQNIFGVFDGATSLDAYVSPDGKTGAYIAADIAATTFAGTSADLYATALAANDAIEATHVNAGIDVRDAIHRFGTTAAVARLTKNQAELLQVADSVILVIYKDERVEIPLGYRDLDIAIMRIWRQLADKHTSNIREVINDDLLALRASSNVSYGVLNGDPRVRDFIKTTTISLIDVASILLLTDGMYIPRADPEAEEAWDVLVKHYQHGGLDEIYKTIRDKEKSDPNLLKYPRYKLHDDASGIAIDFA